MSGVSQCVKQPVQLCQGHSKKAFLDCCDGGASILGARHAHGWDGKGEKIGDGQHGVAQYGHGLRQGSGSDCAGVFVQEDIAPPMQAVFDAPVLAREGEQGLRGGVGAVQTGDGVDGFVRDLAFDLADPLDAADLCHGRPIESGDDLAADGDAAALDASVPLLDALGALTVRRRAVPGGRRGLPLERREQFRGEKRRRRRRQDRP